MALLNKSLRAPPKANMGDKRYGRPGGFRGGWPFTCSYELAERLSAETGLDFEHAHRYVIALGKAAQALLTSGVAVGLPHVGVLHLDTRTVTVQPGGFARYHAQVHGIRAAGPTKPYKVRRKFVRLTQPTSLRQFFDENGVYTGPVEDQVARQKDYLQRRLRKHAKGGLKHTKGA